MTWRRVSGGVAVLASAALVVLAGSQRQELVQPTARPVVQPLTSVSLSCPGFPDELVPPTSVVAVAPVPGASAEGGDRLRITSPGSADPVLGVEPQGAAALRVRVGEDHAPAGVLVTAGGALAPGVMAAQLSTYATDTVTGLTATPCAIPRSEWWFQGVSTSVGVTSTLVLSNPGPAVAVVDLRFLGTHGPVGATGASGVAVAPRSRLAVSLARYAPGRTAMTLQVSATSGTVAAAVAESRLHGVRPNGAEWVPPSAPPQTSVVVNAGASGVGRQTLVVTNPGTRQELVSVRVLDQTGAFVSSDLPNLQVPPGSVVVRDVSAILERQPIALELSAPGPVIGGLVSQQVAAPHDVAISGTSPALTTPAVVPGVNAATLTVAFATSSPLPQPVTIQGYAGNGAPVATATVAVRGAATTIWQPPDDWAAAYFVVTVPHDSDLHAVATYHNASGVAQIPVLSAPRTLLRPGVLP